MRSPHRSPWPAVFLACTFSTILPAFAAEPERIRQETAEHYRQATAAFGLGDYAVAAAHYEQAFALTPDHALLFNAALSHERAGNRERSRTLFANYLRLYAKGSKAAEARRHLEQPSPRPIDTSVTPNGSSAVPEAGGVAPAATATSGHGDGQGPSPSQEAAPAAQDDTTPQGAAALPRPSPPPIPPPPSASAGRVLLQVSSEPAPPPPSPARNRLWRSPWLWGGAALLVGAATVTILVMGRDSTNTSDPPLWGRIQP